jgi:hypothetical protein
MSVQTFPRSPRTGTKLLLLAMRLVVGVALALLQHAPLVGLWHTSCEFDVFTRVEALTASSNGRLSLSRATVDT